MAAGLPRIRTFLSGTPVDNLRDLRVTPPLPKALVEQLHKASRYRDQLHHEPARLPATAGEELHQMVFRKDLTFLDAASKSRLAEE